MKNLERLFLAVIFLMPLLLSTVFSSCKKDKDKDKCEDQYCLNGGDCLDGTCKCPTGYTGEHCETEIATSGYECVSGTCQSVSDNATYSTLSECQTACATQQPTGQVVFWEAQGAAGSCSATNVTINGTTRQITQFFSTAPSCGASGSATFTLNPGTYNYSANCSGATINGTVTVSADQCSNIGLEWTKAADFLPSNITELKLNHTGNGGDKEFNGHGPNVTVTANIGTRNSYKEVWAVVTMTATETQSDWTQGTKTYEVKLYTCPDGWRVSQFTSTTSFSLPYTDNDHALDIFVYSASSLISRVEVMGDTSGNDLDTGGSIEGEAHLHTLNFNRVYMKITRN